MDTSTQVEKQQFVLLADMCGIGLMLCRVGRGGRGAVGQKGPLKQPHLTPLAGDSFHSKKIDFM